MVSPSKKRRAIKFLFESGRCSISFGCSALSLARSSYYYIPRRSFFEINLIENMMLLARRFPRYGYRRMTALLRREGWHVNRKRIQRLMRIEGLRVMSKPKKRKRLGVSTSERRYAERTDHVWTWDFVFDRTDDGRQLKILGILDEFSRECLCLKAARYFRSEDVIDEFSRLVTERGAPEHIRSDNGSEFTAKVVREWNESNSIGAIYIKPGSPWENAYIESFFGSFRDECLTRELFSNLLDARVVIEEWRKEYNEVRPHSALGYNPPLPLSLRPNLPVAPLLPDTGVDSLKEIN